MSTHRVRRPQTYPAMFKDSYSILLSLRDGGSYKKARNGTHFIFEGYKVHIYHDVFDFYRYDKVFMKLHFGKMQTEMLVATDAYYFTVQEGTALAEYEMPLSKDEHFNAMLMQKRFPEWEDMEYVNKIYEILKELGIEYMHLNSSGFYL